MGIVGINDPNSELLKNCIGSWIKGSFVTVASALIAGSVYNLAPKTAIPAAGLAGTVVGYAADKKRTQRQLTIRQTVANAKSSVYFSCKHSEGGEVSVVTSSKANLKLTGEDLKQMEVKYDLEFQQELQKYQEEMIQYNLALEKINLSIDNEKVEYEKLTEQNIRDFDSNSFKQQLIMAFGEDAKILPQKEIKSIRFTITTMFTTSDESGREKWRYVATIKTKLENLTGTLKIPFSSELAITPEFFVYEETLPETNLLATGYMNISAKVLVTLNINPKPLKSKQEHTILTKPIMPVKKYPNDTKLSDLRRSFNPKQPFHNLFLPTDQA